MRSRMTAWLWISGCLAFAAGISAGVLLSKHLGPAQPQRAEPIVAPVPVSFPYLITSKEIFDELQLDDNQRATFSSVLTEQAKELGAIRAALGDLAAVLREQIHGILTPEQLGRFQEIQSRYGKKEIQARVKRASSASSIGCASKSPSSQSTDRPCSEFSMTFDKRNGRSGSRAAARIGRAVRPRWTT